jgi:predicted aldo/keto reductase-like oxidoreductase
MSDNIDEIVKMLNDAYDNDPEAIQALLCNFVPCNKLTADHEHIQVELNNVLEKESFRLSALGLLNGVLHKLFNEIVCVKFGDKEDNFGRRKIIGFKRHDKVEFTDRDD